MTLEVVHWVRWTLTCGAILLHAPVYAQISDLLPKPFVVLVDDVSQAEAAAQARVDVLANDVGLPSASGMRVIDVQPCGAATVDGAFVIVDIGADCTGPVSIIYGVTENLTTQTATLTITLEGADEPESLSPQPAPRVARDDASSLMAGDNVAIEILSNDTFDAALPPSVRIIAEPDCGTAVLENGRLIYESAANCTGDVQVEYSFDTGETAIVRIEIAPAASVCPEKSGLTFALIPKQQFDKQAALAASGLGADLARQLNLYGALPDTQDLNAFCISIAHVGTDVLPTQGRPEQVCRRFDMRNLSVGHTISEARQVAPTLVPNERWQTGLPTPVEIVVALSYLSNASGEANRRFISAMAVSLGRGALGWLDQSCGPDQTLVLGGNCDSIPVVNCYGNEQRREDFGIRLVARPQVGE